MLNPSLQVLEFRCVQLINLLLFVCHLLVTTDIFGQLRAFPKAAGLLAIRVNRRFRSDNATPSLAHFCVLIRLMRVRCRSGGATLATIKARDRCLQFDDWLNSCELWWTRCIQ